MGGLVIFLIYLAGYVLAYYMYRYNMKTQHGFNWNWNNISFGLFISLFSWLTVLIGIFMLLKDSEKVKNMKVKIPKWL